MLFLARTWVYWNKNDKNRKVLSFDAILLNFQTFFSLNLLILTFLCQLESELSLSWPGALHIHVSEIAFPQVCFIAITASHYCFFTFFQSMNILIKQRNTLSDPEVRYFLVQVMDALSYLHNKRIIHRDLKAGNILLKGNSRLIVKLCDFGLSAVLTHESERRKLETETIHRNTFVSVWKDI